LRFGASLVSGVASVSGEESVVALGGLSLRLGVQLDERNAILAEGSGTLLWPAAHGAILFERTPIDMFSIAAGPGVAHWVSPSGSGQATVVTSVVVPVRFAFNVPVGRSPARRRAISLSLEIIPGTVVASNDASISQPSFQLGAMGGVGFELF
jgi:hypothetical protein